MTEIFFLCAYAYINPPLEKMLSIEKVGETGYSADIDLENTQSKKKDTLSSNMLTKGETEGFSEKCQRFFSKILCHIIIGL